MSRPTSDHPRRILYCHCAHARVVPPKVKAAVLEGLAGSGVAFDAVPDLCELAARRDPALVRLAGPAAGDAAGEPARLDVVACYPRAVRWLFHAAEAPLPDEGVRIHNMRTDEAEALLEAVLAPAAERDDPDRATEKPEGSVEEEDA